MRAWLWPTFGIAVILLALVFSAYNVIEFHPYFSELLNWTLALAVGAIAIREESE